MTSSSSKSYLLRKMSAQKEHSWFALVLRSLHFLLIVIPSVTIFLKVWKANGPSQQSSQSSERTRSGIGGSLGYIAVNVRLFSVMIICTHVRAFQLVNFTVQWLIFSHYETVRGDANDLN